MVPITSKDYNLEKKQATLQLYTIKKEGKCPPCKRIIEFLNRLGLEYEIRYVEDHQEYFMWLTGGKSVVPVLVNLENGKLLVGCPVSFDKFVEELQKIL